MRTLRYHGWLWMLFCAAALCVGGAPDKEGPSKLELSGAEHRLKGFEDKVKRMRGQPFKPGAIEQEALQRIADLQKKYPDDPKVKELFERARQALLASKGETTKITPDMLAYRENEKKLKGMFAAEAEKAWEAFRKQATEQKGAIAKAFPAPSTDEADIADLRGKYVVLEGFDYPRNEFTDMGRQFCFVGAGARGFYYVELSNRSWLGAYEALKRYRRLVNRDMPEGMQGTLVGKITNVLLLVPQAGEEKTQSVQWGWAVEPEALYVPGCTFAITDPQTEKGGKFAAEEKMEDVKGALYTVKAVPDNATPERLTEIFITAIKEKNYPLYLECIDPRRRATPKGRDLCMYHWEWHQKRFAEFYCHVVVNPAKISVLQGFDESSTIEGAFLTKEDKEKIKATSEPLVEQAELTTVAYDERGRQYGSPKPRFFRRVEKKRWYITDFAQPF
ncbi:MAG: hypothetical protein FJ290_05445 [Planctomycetes bacterium]|nr:hypothetical protein [Planctomycetota bacterium]